MNLAECLKAQTRALHTELERSALMGSLLRGEMKRAPYCALLRNLHAVYAALEPALERHAEHPGVAPVFFAPLFRSQALADDLAVLHGPGWQREIDTLPAARHYVLHLRRLAADRPELLVAHAYVRYLGDLSGGQLLRRIVASSLGLADGRGTSFYDFGSRADVVVHVQAFRAGLGRVADDAAAVAAIVAEATLSFQLHQQLFRALAGEVCAPAAAANATAVS
jgi:heme oxygenase (biliverdin-producing, ferredoxin)